MWYMRYTWFILSKPIWKHLWIHNCWLKTSGTFLKLIKRLHRIYSTKILLLPDILLVYYLQETDLFVRSIWKRYSAKILGRNTHLMVSTFTGFKYQGSNIEFLHSRKIWYCNIVLFLALFFSFTIICFLRHFCFHCLLFVIFPAYLKLVMQRKRIQ